MLRAVLFDDEYIVVEALSALVDWSGLGIELAGTASDGLSALELFRETRPDIVLTDIRMPGMDGLQLLEIVMREAPNTSCIVFSGFNEFEYVKRSLQLGVSDYIEKPITEKTIERALRKVLEQIGKRIHAELLERQWKSSKRELGEKAAWELLQYGEKAIPKWMEVMEEELEAVVAMTVVASLEEFVVADSLGVPSISVRSGEEFVQLLLHRVWPAEPFWDEIRCVSEQEGIAVGIGDTHAAPESAAESFRQARRALKAALHLRLKGAVRFAELDGLFAEPAGLGEREEALLLSLRAGSASSLMHQVDRFAEWLREGKLDPDLAEREVLRLVYMAWTISEEERPPVAASGAWAASSVRLPHVEVREAAAQGKLDEWFRGQFQAIADGMSRSRDHRTHASIESAAIYIEQNLSRDVSLQEVAEHVGLNATYFSVLFKEVTGETYIKYLTRCRMEKAKVLLRRGMKIVEVSEKVGYLAHRHFAEVFRRATGMTPGQYKERPSEKFDPQS